MMIRQGQHERVGIERPLHTVPPVRRAPGCNRCRDAKFQPHGASEDNRCARRRRTAAPHRRRISVAARKDDAREAGVGEAARRSPAAGADARAARARRHVRRDPDRARVARARTPAFLFMHNEGYSTMCGHGVIAVTTIALERGLLMPGGDGRTIVYDTPAGTIRARARFWRAGRGGSGESGGSGGGRRGGLGVERRVRQRAVVRAARRAGR